MSLKQSIPNDWSIEPLRNVGEIKTGPFGTLLKANEYSSSNGVPLISVGEIGDGRINLLRHTPLISQEITKRMPEYVLKAGDIVFGRKGAVDRSAVVKTNEAGWFLGSDGIRLRPKSSFLANYIGWQLQKDCIKSWLLQNSSGTTMPSMNQEILGRAEIPVAPISEQRKISNALSDIEELISKLDQLIAKKRDIKQAAMQELLTGRRRLPGFSAAWVAKRIDKVAPLQRGFDLTHSEVKPGPYPVAYSNGIANHHAEFKAKGPGIATGRSGTIGNVHYIESDYWPHNTSLFVTNFHGNDPKFVYYLFQHTKLAQFSTGSGVPTLNRNDVHAHVVQIPQAHEEQSAIAQALTDMDTEITALEARREKTRLIKRGMMQELLSGRVRLI